MTKKTSTWKRRTLITLSAIAILVIGIFIWFRLSPVPGSAVIRVVFDKGAADTRLNMEKVVSDIEGVSISTDVNYAPGDKEALLDIYSPEAAEGKLPVVVWTHGGAWLSGDKTDATPYFKKLALEGFIVVSPNYSLAPSKTYPTQTRQLNQALGYISENISKYGGDNTRMILAGDSAGAQLSAQLAAMSTNPAYAQSLELQPTIKPEQIAGMVLYCGIYKMEVLAEPSPTLSKILSWGNRITVWSYTGTRSASTDLIKQMSPYYHATADFPDSFISGGNKDPLTNVQSKPLAEKLQSNGVDIKTLFYSDDHTPEHAHENQFVLDKDGLENFNSMVLFMKEKTGTPL